MEREIEKDLHAWKTQYGRLPLLIRGARQVGKTYIVEKFGREHFEECLTINFEEKPNYAECFQTFDPHHILNSIRALSGSRIEPGRSLLFLDEIQECPRAIMALRYFKEQLPQLHIIGAGSLLEFALREEGFRMPVGRIQFLYMRPLSFMGYLSARGFSHLKETIKKATVKEPLDAVLHDHLLKLMREYMLLGGMPAVIDQYLHGQNMTECQIIQTNILTTYRRDFGKYGPRAKPKYLERLFEKVPQLVSKNFKYVSVDPNMKPEYLREAIFQLRDAGILYPVFATSASGLPLLSLINEKKIKLLMLDVGLMTRACQLEAEVFLAEDILLINDGALAEQLVGQELMAYQSRHDEPHIFYWERDKTGSEAEVDYVTNWGAKIIPIEVKAGTTGRLKSLQTFLRGKESSLGIKISQSPLALEKNILSIPLYMISQIPRLLGRT